MLAAFEFHRLLGQHSLGLPGEREARTELDIEQMSQNDLYDKMMGSFFIAKQVLRSQRLFSFSVDEIVDVLCSHPKLLDGLIKKEFIDRLNHDQKILLANASVPLAQFILYQYQWTQEQRAQICAKHTILRQTIDWDNSSDAVKIILSKADLSCWSRFHKEAKTLTDDEVVSIVTAHPPLSEEVFIQDNFHSQCSIEQLLLFGQASTVSAEFILTQPELYADLDGNDIVKLATTRHLAYIVLRNADLFLMLSLDGLAQLGKFDMRIARKAISVARKYQLCDMSQLAYSLALHLPKIAETISLDALTVDDWFHLCNEYRFIAKQLLSQSRAQMFSSDELWGIGVSHHWNGMEILSNPNLCGILNDDDFDRLVLFHCRLFEMMNQDTQLKARFYRDNRPQLNFIETLKWFYTDHPKLDEINTLECIYQNFQPSPEYNQDSPSPKKAKQGPT